MDKILRENILDAVGIIFSDTLFYKLKFFQGHGIPFLKEDHFSGDFPSKLSSWDFSSFSIKNGWGWSTEQLSMALEKLKSTFYC